MQRTISLLKAIHDQPELKNELEELFEKEHKDILEARKRDKEKMQRHEDRQRTQCAKNIADTIKEICERHGVGEESGYLYFAMDKRLYPKIASKLEYTKDREMELVGERFKDNKMWFKKIDARNLVSIYVEEAWPAANFLEEICELLPKSSERYIKSKMTVEETGAETEKITNEFEKKVFIRKLEKEFRKEQVQKAFQTFDRLDDGEERLLSLYFLYEAVAEKYPEATKAETLKEQIAERFLTQLRANLRSMKKEAGSTTLKILTSSLRRNDTARNRLTEKFLKIHKDVYIQMYLTDLDIEGKFLDSLKRGVHGNIMGSVDFDLLPEEVKETLYSEARKQYETNSLL